MRVELKLGLSVLLVGVLGLGCSDDGGIDLQTALLLRTQDCDDLLQAFKADARAKVELEADGYVNQNTGRGVGGGPDDVFLEGDVGLPTPSAGAEDGADSRDPQGTSDTNRQVASVDEADIVKIAEEGHRLYVLRGNGLYKFDSWPAAATSRMADVEIEGSPMEMFVHDDRAIVFSSVYGLAGIDDPEDCGGGGIEPLPGGADIAFPYYCGRSYVKITSVDLTTNALNVTRQIYFEGWYLSSRRHDDIVRAVIQSSIVHPPSVPYLWDYLNTLPFYAETKAQRAAIASAWVNQAKNAIAKTSLEDWLPVQAERVGGEASELPVQCDSYYAPAPGLTNYGMTQIVGFDSQDDEGPLHMSAILGSASYVYSNADVMVLAQPEWAWSLRGNDSDRTAVHRFEILSDLPMTLYGGSGFVPGYVQDQFSMDERDGVIRLATTRTTWTNSGGGFTDEWIPPVTDNLVTTMALQGGELTQLGQTPPMAEGERIFSARFLGDIGYIVTFRQIDPLFAIDLKNPTKLKVLGEASQESFEIGLFRLGHGGAWSGSSRHASPPATVRMATVRDSTSTGTGRLPRRPGRVKRRREPR